MQTSLLGWLTTELQGSPWFYPPLAIARITDVCCCTLLLHVCWGSGLGFSCLCEKRFTSQATSLALKPVCFQRPTAFMEDSWNLQEYKKSKACPLPWLDCLLLSSLLTFPSSWFIMKDGWKHVRERISVGENRHCQRQLAGDRYGRPGSDAYCMPYLCLWRLWTYLVRPGHWPSLSWSSPSPQACVL